MSIVEQGVQEFQPYARLINIIGDQLITDKIVAVVEVIKNSYDADASNVIINFHNFYNFYKEKLKYEEEPYIEIIDDGIGMTKETILDVWMKPATPEKFEKKQKDKFFTQKGRIMQGEKGIGRFAIHKIGKKIDLFSKAKNHDEVKLELDFRLFDPEEEVNKKQKYKLLSQIKNKWSTNSPSLKIKSESGTSIKINNLREEWSDFDIQKLDKAISKLIPPVEPNETTTVDQDFSVNIFINGEKFFNVDKVSYEDIFERAPFKMKGEIDKYCDLHFEYQSNYRKFKKTVNLFANENYDVSSIRNRFFEKKSKTNEAKLKRNKPQLGNIKFSFYAFNLKNRDKTIITKEIEEFLKANKVYVYRDSIRVYPFGEPDYDWLELDKLRAQIRAGNFFSYNDLIGFVYISQKGNPLLKDATNRQGMMDINGAYEDFKALMVSVVEIMKFESDIDKQKAELNKRINFKDTYNLLTKSTEEFSKYITNNVRDKKILELSNKLVDSFRVHLEIVQERLNTVEDLAGLGLAVEKASHDALMLLSKFRTEIIQQQKNISTIINNKSKLESIFKDFDDRIKFIYESLQIIQPLFKVAMKNIKNVDVGECIQKVIRYFRNDLDKIDVQVIVKESLIVKTSEGLILQIFINLIDNAIYWLNFSRNKPKQIIIEINGKENKVIVSDSGIGIEDDIIPLIFQEFFTRKAEGRGLGLYIVKELLDRINSEIDVIINPKLKILKGANFLINFNKKGK